MTDEAQPDPQPLDHLIDKREDFWQLIRNHCDDAMYLNMRNHFDEHLADIESSIEGAYLCLCSQLLALCENFNNMSLSYLAAIIGDRPFCPHEGGHPQEEGERPND